MKTNEYLSKENDVLVLDSTANKYYPIQTNHYCKKNSRNGAKARILATPLPLAKAER